MLQLRSFAINPVISAVDILQSPKPRGANTGAIKPASIASRLSWESATTLSRLSKVCRHHITMVATNITVNASAGNPLPFSQSNRLYILSSRKAIVRSSITKGTGSPLKHNSTCKCKQYSHCNACEIQYNHHQRVLSGKNVAEKKSVYRRLSRAPLINGVRSMVILRSLSMAVSCLP